jgi:hypothetical protein
MVLLARESTFPSAHCKLRLCKAELVIVYRWSSYGTVELAS